MAHLFDSCFYQKNSDMSILYREYLDSFNDTQKEKRLEEKFFSNVFQDIKDLENVTKGDVVMIHLESHYHKIELMYIFDGLKYTKIVIQNVIPKQFSIIHDYPTNYWNKVMIKPLIELDITSYKEEIIKNFSRGLFDNKIEISLESLRISVGHPEEKRYVKHYVRWTKFVPFNDEFCRATEQHTPQLYKDVWNIIHEYSKVTYYIIFYNNRNINIRIKYLLETTKYFETISTNENLNNRVKDYIDRGILLFGNAFL